MLNDKDFPWRSLGTWLVPIFVAVFFFPGLHLLKSLLNPAIIFLALARSIAPPSGDGWQWRSEPLVICWLVLLASVMYGIVLAPDPSASLAEARSPVFLYLGILPWCLMVLGDDETLLRRIGLGFAIGALLMNGVELMQYAQELGSREGIAPYAHRHYSDSLVYLLPFLWLAARWSPARWARAAWMTVLVLQIPLIFLTAARGAWLGGAIAIGILLYYTRSWKTMAALTALTAGGLLLVLASTPDSLVAMRIKQGADTSFRLGNGTWGTAWELVRANPVIGHGFGQYRYHEIYNGVASDHPGWVFRTSIGPHNSVLQHWFAAGLFGLAAIVAFYGALLGRLAHLVRQALVEAWERELAVAVAAAFLGAIVVRGMMESISFREFGPLLGVALILLKNQGRRLAAKQRGPR